MELVEVAPDVFACLQRDEGLGTSNSGLVRRGGGLVVDSFWDLPSTRRLRDLYASVAPDAPARLLNTHHNGDHCWGNQVFAEAGAEILGHRLCPEYLLAEGPPELFVALAESDEVPPGLADLVAALRRFDFRGITLTPPTTLFDGDAVLDLDGTPVELLYVGPAHTAGDMAVWLPDEGVLFTGDVLFHRCTPIGWEGTFAGWIAALERLAALEPQVVVPGHGPLADVSGLLGLRDYLAYVRGEARQHHEAGRTVLEAAERIELGPYAGWNEPERLVFQVDRAYRELDGEPWDTKVDLVAVIGTMAQLRAEWAAREGVS
ncbi:MAG: MBL fold metallo-hydrolase [Acidimicrobiales bacterium]|jgi:glyoxylase-like metal-dependent hydrolase (beta-lactamase superfamily II)|nr:MBL fold metallo-hydrolase [Acidimicrobiales bacterium]